MVILGIGDSHEAHACIVKDGVLCAAAAEERFSRLKADMGYPRQAIEAVMRASSTSASEIDVVAFAGQAGGAFLRIFKPNANFSVHDWIRQCHEYWKPVLLEGKALSARYGFDLFHEQFADSIQDNPYYRFVSRSEGVPETTHSALLNDIRAEVVQEHLGIGPERVRFYRHEDCHQAYGYYSRPERLDRALVLTLEGGGDDSSATVSTVEKGQFREHWKSNAVMLGRLYRYVTLVLGMLPGQHEYKVMGLAPYGSRYHGRRSLDFFRRINEVSGIEILNTGFARDMYFTVREALEGERFDGIAWGLQVYLEEVLVEWIQNCAQHFHTGDVIFSGGVAQNIKACKSMLGAEQVDSLWVGPISGDGSLGVGAAWLAQRESAPGLAIEGLGSAYLGTGYQADTIARAIDAQDVAARHSIVTKPSPTRVAQWLAEGRIIARYSGRMEFGQRALGNRSILADPRRQASVDHINRKIKNRDFWMPFTPSMLDDDAQRYLVNPKRAYSPFMTMAFDLQEGLADKLPAVIHPGDKTVRPQMLRRIDNPGYHDLITAFKAETGLGVLLNTSFNLHGDAIVESPEQAIDTFERSDLDVLVFDELAITRGAAGDRTNTGIG